MNKWIKVAMILVCPIALVGCATITTGTNQRIPINSNPAGATVNISSGFTGVTPCVADLRRNQDHTVNISKIGYDTAVVVLRKSMCGSTAGNLLLGGVIGLGVDACSGAMFKLEPLEINAQLNRTGVTPVEPAPAAPIIEPPQNVAK